MPVKKLSFADDEIAIYDDAIIYKRGDYWQFRMWLWVRSEIRLDAEQTKGRYGRVVFVSEKLRKELQAYIRAVYRTKH